MKLVRRRRKFKPQVKKFVEEHLVIRRNHQGGTDSWYSLRRIRESL
jgi:hypothetical protein